MFQWLPSIVEPRKIPVSFIKTTKSYEVCRLGYHLGSTFTGMDRNKLAKLPDRTRLSGPCIDAIAIAGVGTRITITAIVCFIMLL